MGSKSSDSFHYKKIGIFGLKAAVSFVLLFILLKRADLWLLLKQVKSIGPSFFIGAIVVYMIAWNINTYKWLILVRRIDPTVSYFHLLKLNYISMFYYMVLPGQISGEAIKSVKLAKRTTWTTSLVPIVLDKYTGLIAITMLAIIGLYLPSPVKNKQTFALVAIILLLVLLLLSIIFLNEQLASYTESKGKQLFTKRLRKLKDFLKPAWLALKETKKKPFIYALFLSVIFQFLVSAMTFVIATGLSIKIVLFDLFFIVAVSSLLQVLPISISGLGIREGAFVFFLSQYGVSGEKAMALSLLIFSIFIVMALLGGTLEAYDQFFKR